VDFISQKTFNSLHVLTQLIYTFKTFTTKQIVEEYCSTHSSVFIDVRMTRNIHKIYVFKFFLNFKMKICLEILNRIPDQ